MRARAASAAAAANAELHEQNIHHTRTGHNETQPKLCFTAVFKLFAVFKSRTETATNRGSLSLCYYVFYLNI